MGQEDGGTAITRVTRCQIGCSVSYGSSNSQSPPNDTSRYRSKLTGIQWA